MPVSFRLPISSICSVKLNVFVSGGTDLGTNPTMQLLVVEIAQSEELGWTILLGHDFLHGTVSSLKQPAASLYVVSRAGDYLVHDPGLRHLHVRNRGWRWE